MTGLAHVLVDLFTSCYRYLILRENILFMVNVIIVPDRW